METQKIAPQPEAPRSSDQRGRDIQAFLAKYGSPTRNDLLSDMIVTVCRLARDECGRGEIKILNKALKELRYAFKVFAPYADVPKVSIFGSARTKEDHPEYLQAVKFAQLIQKEGWMVITGAGDGIMRAGHHGATREASFGVSISLPFEQSTNTIIADDDKLVNFKYFFTRKLMFVRSSSAIALFPGGFGTMDEGFEVLTLVQTGKSVPMPIVFVDSPGSTYWARWQEYVEKELLSRGLIGPDDLHLYRITPSVEEAVHEVTHFYSNFHSVRYVRDELVMRLQRPITPDQLATIQSKFKDILTAGDFRTGKALPVERDEESLIDLPRLIFKFNRRDHGRLRLLINYLNDLK